MTGGFLVSGAAAFVGALVTLAFLPSRRMEQAVRAEMHQAELDGAELHGAELHDTAVAADEIDGAAVPELA